MELLDKLVLPQSSEHLQLLHYLLMLIFFLFIPFIGMIFGGTALSLYFKRKAGKTLNNNYGRFAKEIIEIVTINKSSGVILGIVPLLSVVMMYAQILHTADLTTVGLILFAFLLTSVSLVLIYSYRYSLGFKGIFDALNITASQNAVIADDFNKLSKGTTRMSLRAGKWGLLFLFIALWIFTAAVTQVFYVDEWGKHNIFYIIFSYKALLRFLYLILASLTITGAVILFAFFYWEGGRKFVSEEYKQLVCRTGVNLALYPALIIPVIAAINLIILPAEVLSVSIFTASLIGLLLLFLAYNFLYALTRNGNLKYSGHAFFAIIFALMAFIVKDQLAMSNSTKTHAAVLNHDFELFLGELRGEGLEGEVVNAAEIFTARCSSCHKYDEKLVGPPYNDVLPKYEGNENQLIAFIRNPVKVDPAYPPMPNPGLKPNEAEAIAIYLLEEFKKR